MDFTIKPALEKLNNKIESTKSQLNEKFETQETLIKNSLVNIKSDISKELNEHLTSCNKLHDEFLLKSNDIDIIKNDLSNKYNRMRLDLREVQDSYNRDLSKRYEILLNTVEASEKTFNRKIDTFRLSFKDNADKTDINYVDFTGRLQQLSVKKHKFDNSTIKLNDKNELYWNYKFDNKTLKINSEDNSIYATGLYVGDNTYLRANDIKNDLSNATYNIGSITYKLEKILAKLNTVNGYLASNNFNKKDPSQESLTNFILSCLSTVNKEVEESDLTAGTKIKNTFDNHIWVLNKIKGSDGLTQLKWEDFGSDNICIAGNNGVHGLVSGSQDKLKGYIDVKGVISINGLEEDLTNITQSILEIKNDIIEYKLNVDSRLSELESKIMTLDI